jgi:bile acid-coenzyme A ligase
MSVSTDIELISYGRRLSLLAGERPDQTAIVFARQAGGELEITRRELDQTSNRLARLFAERAGPDPTLVVIGLPNSPEHYFATYAAWKSGACVLPMRWDLPRWERDRMLEIARASIVVADWEEVEGGAVVRTADFATLERYSAAPLPDRTPNPAVAIGSGGSTGRPKIIRTPSPGAAVPGLAAGGATWGWTPGHTHLIAGPLYHMSPFWNSHLGLFDEQKLIVMERFEAARAIDLIERHRVNGALLVPTMLYRMLRVPGVRERDFSSVASFVSGGAALAAWVMEGWIEILGPTRMWEAYGATESHGNTFIRGDEWLEHRGSVGRPWNTELRILDDRYRELPAGEVGEIFMKRTTTETPTFEYVGVPPPRTTKDGLVSVGDLGWVDADGYLFIADRRADMIITGGANVYPAEVETALSEHPGVYDVAVVGIADPDWGKRVHAIVRPVSLEAPPSTESLDRHCRERLARYKIPKSYEFVEDVPRSFGKVRRSALAAERSQSMTPAAAPPATAASPVEERRP